MRKIISKIAGLMLGLSLTAGVGVSLVNHKAKQTLAADFTLSSADSVTVDGITVSFAKGAGSTAPTWYSAGLRLYASNTVTVSSSNSISSVTFNWEKQGSKAFATVTADVGTYSHPSAAGEGTWTGSATTIVFTLGSSGQLQLNTLSATSGGGGGGGGGETTSYDVSFNMQGHGTQVSSQTIESGGKVTEPTAPTADGYTFGGWYKEAACSTAWNFSTDTVSAATILYAKWTANVVPSGGSYTLVTSVSDLANNDLVVIGTVGSTGPVNGVTGMNTSTNKDATVSSTESEWVKYTVTLSGTGFTLADGTDSIYMIAKTIKYDTATVLSVTSDGYLCLDSDATTILYEQSTYIRPYQGKAGADGYTPYAVYKYGESIDPSLGTMTIKSSGTEADGQSFDYKTSGSYTFAAYDESTQVSGVSWSSSDETVATINASTGVLTTIKPGSVTITAEANDYNNASAAITIAKGTIQSIVVSGAMTKTAYYVGESWDHSGLTATGTYSTGWQEDVSSSATWTYNPASPAINVDSVIATATISSVAGSSSAQSVSVTRTNPIQVLYTQSAGTSVDVYGYYVGFLDGTGPVIMDGAYGIVIYNKTADVSGYTANETILHVTGSISIYKGLYEIASPTISVASGSFDAPEAPVVYATTGNETAEYAARLTTVTGTPSLVSGSFDSDAGTADITLSFAVGTKAVQVFYKKAAQTADADAFAAIKDAVANSSEITIKGFTGWFDGFQVQMNGYVPAVETYTAEDFAQDLLDQTDAVCLGYKDGDNNHDALEAIWSDLASNDKYPSLPSAQKTILAEAERDESGDVVERAMARYDYLTGKYNLSNFINGRTPIVVAGSNFVVGNNTSANSSTIIIVIVALTSITSIGVLLVIKRKRSLVK